MGAARTLNYRDTSSVQIIALVRKRGNTAHFVPENKEIFLVIGIPFDFVDYDLAS